MVEFSYRVFMATVIMIAINFIASYTIPSDLCEASATLAIFDVSGAEQQNILDKFRSFVSAVVGYGVSQCLTSPFSSFYLFIVNIVNAVMVVEIILLIRRFVGFT